MIAAASFDWYCCRRQHYYQYWKEFAPGRCCSGFGRCFRLEDSEMFQLDRKSSGLDSDWASPMAALGMGSESD